MAVVATVAIPALVLSPGSWLLGIPKLFSLPPDSAQQLVVLSRSSYSVSWEVAMATWQKRVHWAGRWLRKFPCRGGAGCCSPHLPPPFPPTLPWYPGQGYVQTFGLPPVAVEVTTSCLNCQATLTILHLALTIYWSLQIVKGIWGWHAANP